MKRTALYLLCAFAMMGICLWMAVSVAKTDGQTVPYRRPDRVESYTVGSFDKLQISKTYVLCPEETPACVSTEDFQEYGSRFHLSEVIRKYVDGVEICTAIFDEAGPIS